MKQCEYCKSELQDNEVVCGKCPNCGALVSVVKTVTGVYQDYYAGNPILSGSHAGTSDARWTCGTIAPFMR